MPDYKGLKKYDTSVIDAARCIAETFVGTRDTDYNTLTDTAEWLRWRITTQWDEPTQSSTSSYDDAVRMLAIEALDIFELWKKKKEEKNV